MTSVPEPAATAVPRTCAEVNLGAIVRNYQSLRRILGDGVEVVAVVKANAYGHGFAPVGKALSAAGCGWFAVACLGEGVSLREAGIAGEILILGGFLPGEEATGCRHRLTPHIHNRGQLLRWNTQAASASTRPAYHIELDTGMHRMGWDSLDAQPLAEDLAGAIEQATRADFHGLATHLASAENFRSDQTHRQNERFQSALRHLESLGIHPRHTHIANGAAAVLRPSLGGNPSLDGNMVRAGLALYGYLAPVVGSPPVAPLQLEPALAWKARLAGVRNVSRGSSLGYSASYAAAKPMRVGVVSVGYGDGFDRRLSNGGAVLVRGRRCPVVGLVSMDVTLIDLSALPAAAIGDEVTLIGPSLDAQAMAGHCGTITYEVLSRISSRVPRVYRAP